jgi:hypothetical protein
MRENIEKIKKTESSPKIIKNLFTQNEIEDFLKLYNDLPITVHNKKQNVIKKRWLQGYNDRLENSFCERLKKEIGDFKMDNLQDENNKDILVERVKESLKARQKNKLITKRKNLSKKQLKEEYLNDLQ